MIFIDEADYINLLEIGKPFLNDIEQKIKMAFFNSFKQSAFVTSQINKLNITDGNFYNDLLDIANSERNKKTGGEIALFILVQILCLLKEKANYKIFSDDSDAFPYLSSLTKILKERYPKANIAYISTIRNIQILTRSLNLSYQQILDYLSNIKRNEGRNIYLRELPKDIIENKIEILF